MEKEWQRTEKGRAYHRAYCQTDKHKAYNHAYYLAHKKVEKYSDTEKLELLKQRLKWSRMKNHPTFRQVGF